MEGVRRSGRVQEPKHLLCRELKDDESRRSWCSELDTGLGFAQKAGSSLTSGSSRRVHDRVIYNEKNVLAAVVKVISSSTWHRNLTTK